MNGQELAAALLALPEEDQKLPVRYYESDWGERYTEVTKVEVYRQTEQEQTVTQRRMRKKLERYIEIS